MALALLMCASSALAVTDHGEYDGCECISNGEFFLPDAVVFIQSNANLSIATWFAGDFVTLCQGDFCVQVRRVSTVWEQGSPIFPKTAPDPNAGTGGGGGGGGGSGPAWQPTIWRNGHVTVG